MPHRSDPHGSHSSSASPFGRGWIPASRDIGLRSGDIGSGDDLDWAAWVQQAQRLTEDADIRLPQAGGVRGGPVAFAGCAEPGTEQPRPQPHPPTGGIVFTPPRIAQFLEALSREGNVRFAAQAAGVSAQTAYVRRRRDRAFAAGWEAALIIAREAAEQVLATRAIHGITETIWFRGEVVGERQRFDTRLLLAHLARLDARAHSAAPHVHDLVSRFDAMLADLSNGVEPASAADLPDPARDAFVTRAMDAAERAYLRDCPEPVTLDGALASDAEWDAWEAALATARDDAFHAAHAQWAAAPGVEYKSAAPPAMRSLDSVNPVNPGPDRQREGRQNGERQNGEERSKKGPASLPAPACSPEPAGPISGADQRPCCASSRNRSAFSLIKPAASFWSYAPASSSNVTWRSEYRLSGDWRPTTHALPLYSFSRTVPFTRACE